MGGPLGIGVRWGEGGCRSLLALHSSSSHQCPRWLMGMKANCFCGTFSVVELLDDEAAEGDLCNSSRGSSEQIVWRRVARCVMIPVCILQPFRPTRTTTTSTPAPPPSRLQETQPDDRETPRDLKRTLGWMLGFFFVGASHCVAVLLHYWVQPPLPEQIGVLTDSKQNTTKTRSGKFCEQRCRAITELHCVEHHMSGFSERRK